VSSLGRGFDAIAEEYDEVRPDYPAELYDAIEQVAGPLGGADVLDLAAGTGIATRELTARGARVIAVEPGEPMVRRLHAVSPGVLAIAAAAEALPLHDDVVDLVTCATAWHWLDTARTLAELQRVLRPGGHIALWWANNRWGDDSVAWEVARSAVYDRWETEHGSRPAADGYAGAGPRDAAADLRQRGLEIVVETEFRWARDRTREDHIRTIATHSDVIALGDRKQVFLAEVAAALAPWPVVTERLWGPLVVARLCAGRKPAAL
jgi:SAM-dependent methyltransferase